MIAELEADKERGKDIVVEIEPENADAVRIFRQMQTQWRRAVITTPKAVVLVHESLDYTPLPTIAGAIGAVLSEECLDALRIMEAETLLIFAKRNRDVLRR